MTVPPETRTRLRKRLIGLAVLLIVALPVLYSAIVVPLSPWQQAEVALALLGFAMIASLSRALRPLIIFLSCFASMRYFYWRVTSTLSMDTVPDAVVSTLLLGAEIYGLSILFLGYFQTIEVQRRNPAPLHSFPTVDVFIPTYNEPVDIVRRTVIGALAVDYPRKKIHVLDDGKRAEMEAMARELGCAYVTRPDNRHAKAGNLNHAMEHANGDLVAILDADHVPVRGFLKKMVGFFEDDRVALVQSAQHFFNPDPYERNLNLTGRVAPEQMFFYHVVQPGNDFWDSAFFCGSGAVLRRSAIDSIGGFKTQTITEDAHTALILHSKGYSSVYLPLPLAAGLSTETFAAHVKQRIRWARGMAQILRIDCPLFKKGLALPQRLNYFNAMLHFFFGIPRIIMIVAPLTYLLLGIHPIKADVLAVLAYILPHIGLSTLANSLLGQNFRHSFWAEVYEISIAPYTAGVTLLAMVNPRLGKFNVTDKGTSQEEARFDFATSRGTLLLLGLSFAALMAGLPLRLLLFDPATTDPTELHSVLINSLWAIANVFTLVAAACVAYEPPQQRAAPRILRDFPCEARFGPSGRAATAIEEERPDSLRALRDVARLGRTVDVSENGIRVAFSRPFAVPERGQLVITGDLGAAVSIQAERVWCDWDHAGPSGRAAAAIEEGRPDSLRAPRKMEAAFRFVDLDAVTHRHLVEMMFSPDESWLKRTHPRDEPFRSFAYLISTFWRVTQPRRARRRRAPRVAGDWRCVVDGIEGRCLSISPFGALVESALPETRGEPLDFAIDIEPGRRLEARGRLVRQGPEKRFAIELEWPAEGALEAFARALYASRSTPISPPRRPSWRRLGVFRA